MRNVPNVKLNRYRVRDDALLGSDDRFGNRGLFHVPQRHGPTLCCISSDGLGTDGMGWEHVSVSPMGADRCPTWEEMCLVKRLFWRDDETVVQFHPADDRYVNDHAHVLHLWRHLERPPALPPAELVGPGLPGFAPAGKAEAEAL